MAKHSGMIRLTEINDIIKMEIKMHLPQSDIITFLQMKGYEIKSWLWKYFDETFPGGIEYHEKWTFTATKPGEEQSEKTLILSVFENEIKELLKDI